MPWRRHMSLWIVAFCLWTVPSQAALLDPWAFTSLGTLNATEAVTINTDTLQLTGGASYTGVLDPVTGAGIFAFDDMTATDISILGSARWACCQRATAHLLERSTCLVPAGWILER